MQQSTLLRTHQLVHRWGQSCGNCSPILQYFVQYPLHLSAAIALFANIHTWKSVTKGKETSELRKDEKLDSIVYQFQKTLLKVKDKKIGYSNIQGSQTVTLPVAYNLKNKRCKGPLGSLYNSKNDNINHTDTPINCSIETINATKHSGNKKQVDLVSTPDEKEYLHYSREKRFTENSTNKDERNSELAVVAPIDDTKSDLQKRKVTVYGEGVQDHPLQPLVRPKILTCEEQSLVHDLLGSVQHTKKITAIETFTRQNVQPPFAVLQHLCAWAGKSDQVGVIHKVQKLIQKIYPDEYHQHLGFKYYHASALCYAGDVREGLEELTQLYSSQPQGQKKIKDTVTFIIYHIINSNNEDHEKLVFNFVNNLAVGQGQLSPALSLWCACFSSSLYRLQVMSEVLLERHSGLIRMLERKLDNMVRRAAWDGDDELLHRILQLTLHYKLSKKISSVTSTLLQLQCDIGDLHGADETIKFAQRVRVRLTPSTVQRFLALLNHHRRPAPLYLLALKYGPSPPKTSVPKPPKFKYKF